MRHWLATDGDLPELEMKAIVTSLTALVQGQQKQIETLVKKIEKIGVNYDSGDNYNCKSQSLCDD